MSFAWILTLGFFLGLKHAVESDHLAAVSTIVSLSDPNLTLARKFGIVYQMPKETDELYKSKGLNVAEHNQMEKAELPLSATYIVNQKGEIVYAFLETDYKKRAAPEAIIETLSKIKPTRAKK